LKVLAKFMPIVDQIVDEAGGAIWKFSKVLAMQDTIAL
jgi:hypothetical protein